MKKINIVKSSLEFNNIINKSRYVKNKYFVIYFEGNNINKYRVGITAPKKLGTAVLRNKLKRQVRNILDNHRNLCSNGRDYIIIVRKGSLDLIFKELEENLVYLLEKIEKEKINEKK